MTSVMINLVFIWIICVLVVDISGFIQSIKRGLSWMFTKGKIVKDDFYFKPFDCSLCMTWWSCFIYLIVVGQASLFTIMIALLLAVMSPVLKEFIILITDILIKIINKIYDLIEK